MTTLHATMRRSSSSNLFNIFSPTRTIFKVLMIFLSHIIANSKYNFIALFLDHLPSIDSFGMGTNLSTTLNNTPRAIYHATRLNLGVIRSNQIYNSSARFNASITNLTFTTGNASAVSSILLKVRLCDSMQYTAQVAECGRSRTNRANKGRP